jgi:hypothetical protein
MKQAGTPTRPREMRLLNVEPPGDAAVGTSSLKIISSMVSPIPITFRIPIFCYACFENANLPLFSDIATMYVLFFKKKNRHSRAGSSLELRLFINEIRILERVYYQKVSATL